MNKTTKENVRIEGHRGRWHEIDFTYDMSRGRKIYLMEHSTYGEDANLIIIDEYNNILMEDVTEGFEEYFEIY